MKYLRRTMSAAVGNDLGTTTNEHNPAMHNERRRGQWPGHLDQIPATHNERRRGQRLGATIKYLRCTTSGAAGNGLGTAIKFLRAAASIGLSTTTKKPARRRRNRSWYHDQVPVTLNKRRRGQRRPVHHDQGPARRRGNRPGNHDKVPATHNEFCFAHMNSTNTVNKHTGRTSYDRSYVGTPASFIKHTGRDPINRQVSNTSDALLVYVLKRLEIACRRWRRNIVLAPHELVHHRYHGEEGQEGDLMLNFI